MKLKDCIYGKMVITEELEVGYIVGVTYNVDIAFTGGMTNEDKFEHTIPLVQFPSETRGIHHSNIKPF
jgi:hypothetical protein